MYKVQAYLHACLLLRRIVDHPVVVFARRDRPPRRSPAAFLRRARTCYHRYHVPGAALPARARVHRTLVRLGAHRTCHALQLSAALLRRTAKLTGRLRKRLRTGALRLHHRVRRLLPVRADRAVFAAHGVGENGCHPGGLEQAFRDHAPRIRTAWVADAGQRGPIPSGTRAVRPGTAARRTALARSKYLVPNAGFDRGPVKRRGQVLVLTQRGTPLKHMGPDLRERPAAADGTNLDELLDDVDDRDHGLSGNRHSALVRERVRRGTGLNRPIVIHADDRKAYEAARGTYFGLRSFPPGAISCGEDELIDIFATGHWRGSRSAEPRSVFRERFRPHDDGRAAERAVRHAVLGEPDGPAVVPLGRRHPVPSPAASLTHTPPAAVPQPAEPVTVTESR